MHLLIDNNLSPAQDKDLDPVQDQDQDLGLDIDQDLDLGLDIDQGTTFIATTLIIRSSL